MNQAHADKIQKLHTLVKDLYDERQRLRSENGQDSDEFSRLWDGPSTPEERTAYTRRLDYFHERRRDLDKRIDQVRVEIFNAASEAF